jgi:hypothetical protein
MQKLAVRGHLHHRQRQQHLLHPQQLPQQLLLLRLHLHLRQVLHWQLWL